MVRRAQAEMRTGLYEETHETAHRSILAFPSLNNACTTYRSLASTLPGATSNTPTTGSTSSSSTNGTQVPSTVESNGTKNDHDGTLVPRDTEEAYKDAVPFKELIKPRRGLNTAIEGLGKETPDENGIPKGDFRIVSVSTYHDGTAP